MPPGKISGIRLSPVSGIRVAAAGASMAVRFSIRKACPGCGKAMLVMPDADDERPLRYVCTACGDDPLRDPTAPNWADGPLKPPEP